MIRLEMKNCNKLLTKKQQKYQRYYLKKLINLTSEEILPSNQRRIIEQAKFVYYALEKLFEKQTGKQVNATKSLDPSNTLNLIVGIFPQNVMNSLIWC